MQLREALAAGAADAAVRYLNGHGVRVLDRNWRHEEEILSIVAAERSTLVVIDLRVRASARSTGSVEAASTARLRTLGTRWLASHGTRYDRIRVDRIGLVLDGTAGFTLEHVRAVG